MSDQRYDHCPHCNCILLREDLLDTSVADDLKALACWESDDGEGIDITFIESTGPSSVPGMCRWNKTGLVYHRAIKTFYVVGRPLPHIKTRGDLRRLLKALGWKGKEAV